MITRKNESVANSSIYPTTVFAKRNFHNATATRIPKKIAVKYPNNFHRTPFDMRADSLSESKISLS